MQQTYNPLRKMVNRMSRELAELLRLEGIKNQDVLDAIATVPRHEFVDLESRAFAYADEALPIGHGQTISQPFVVARMTELLLAHVAHPLQRVLEIGTGSGYQAAVLAKLVPEVYTIERIKPLYLQAVQRLAALGYHNIQVRYGDGRLGWEQHSPFDGILVTAGAASVPPALTEQLAEGGCLIIPLQSIYYHELCLLHKKDNQIIKQAYDPVLFVPLKSGVE